MMPIEERLAQNVAGEFYVTIACIDCDQCREIAPTVFRRDEEISLSVVFAQPTTPIDRAAAEEARVSCPTDAIQRS